MRRGAASARPELRQRLPEEIVNGLLSLIRRQFVPDVSDKEWFREHNGFIKRNVVLWPARFMVGKGFTVSGERYERIMVGILNEIKRHGQTGAVRYWPGYLMRCVQTHWEHQWETYYNEAKALGAQADAALLALKARLGDNGAQAVEAMAAAHRLLKGPGKRRLARGVKQGELGL